MYNCMYNCMYVRIEILCTSQSCVKEVSCQVRDL